MSILGRSESESVSLTEKCAVGFLRGGLFGCNRSWQFNTQPVMIEVDCEIQKAKLEWFTGRNK